MVHYSMRERRRQGPRLRVAYDIERGEHGASPDRPPFSYHCVLQ